MICTCSGEVRKLEHEILMDSAVRKWAPTFTGDYKAPVTVSRDVCGACGRQDVLVTDADGQVLRSQYDWPKITTNPTI